MVRNLNDALIRLVIEVTEGEVGELDLRNSDISVAMQEDYNKVWIYVGYLNGQVVSYEASYSDLVYLIAGVRP